MLSRVDRLIIGMYVGIVTFLIGFLTYSIKESADGIQAELFNIHDRLTRIEADINTWKGDY